MEDLREKTIKGLGWSAAEKWLSQAINLLIFIILARLLNPEVFGLVAMASVFTSLMQVFLDQGFTAAIIQRSEINNEVLDTAFWVNVIIGVILTILGILLSNFIADFYNEPRLSSIVAWLSLTFFFTALSSTQQGILRRQLDFRSLAIRTFIARLIGGVVGLTGAFLGWGVWCLVAQMLVSSLVGIIMLWHVSDWRPHFRFSRDYARDLFSFGLFIAGNKFLAFLDYRIDDLLIGYFLGATMLGYYTIAYNLMMRLISLTESVTTIVSTSTFSRLQDDLEQMLRAFYKASKFTSILVFPLFIGVTILAPELIPLLFGQNWEPSILVMQLLAPAGIAFSLFTYSGSMIISLGKPKKVFQLRLLATGSRIVGFVATVTWGINAIAIVFTLTTLFIVWPLYIRLGNQFTPFNLRIYLTKIIVPFVASSVMALVIWLIKPLLMIENNLLAVITYVLVGATAYLSSVYLIKPNDLREIYELGLQVFPSFNRRANKDSLPIVK